MQNRICLPAAVADSTLAFAPSVPYTWWLSQHEDIANVLQGLYLLATGQTKAGLVVGTSTSAALLLLDIKRAYDVGESSLLLLIAACYPTVLPGLVTALDIGLHSALLVPGWSCDLLHHPWAVSYMPCWQAYQLCPYRLAPD